MAKTLYLIDEEYAEFDAYRNATYPIYDDNPIEEDACLVESPYFYICTRRTGHDGEHRAFGGEPDYPYEIWVD